jgi:hypothetical protein
MQSWDRTINAGDGIGRFFRLRAVISPTALTSLVTRLTPKAVAARPARKPAAARKPVAAAAPKVRETVDRAAKPITDVLDKTTKTVSGLLDYLLK